MSEFLKILKDNILSVDEKEEAVHVNYQALLTFQEQHENLKSGIGVPHEIFGDLKEGKIKVNKEKMINEVADYERLLRTSNNKGLRMVKKRYCDEENLGKK